MSLPNYINKKFKIEPYDFHEFLCRYQCLCIHENGKNYFDGITSLIYKSCPTTSFAAYREDNSPFDKWVFDVEEFSYWNNPGSL